MERQAPHEHQHQGIVIDSQALARSLTIHLGVFEILAVDPEGNQRQLGESHPGAAKPFAQIGFLGRQQLLNAD